MEIKDIIKENNIFLAPMAGVTDAAFRTVCKSFGVGLTCSEMVSTKGLYYGDKKTASLMRRGDGEAPYAVQIFGSEPEIIAYAAKHAAPYADIIDINMGCPAPKIVNNGDGCALMKDPLLMGRIVNAAVQSVNKPVTVKMRMGWDEAHITAVEAARLIEENGAAAVTVHGRVRMQFYSGKANRDIIREIKNSVKIPVIGNGDIFCAGDAKEMLEYTGCDAVAVARGAQGNPFLFRQIAELLKTGTAAYCPGYDERLDTALWHIRLMVREKGEERAIKVARKHLAWYIKGMRNGTYAKGMIFKACTLAEVEDIITELKKMNAA